MRGDFKMLRTVVCLAALCGVVHSSGVHQLQAPLGSAPIVTAASSQYFERTFNRLVAAPPLLPVTGPQHLVPVAPPPPQFVPVAAQPPVFVQTAQALPAPLPQPPVIPFQAVQPAQSIPVQPSQPPHPVQPAQPVEPNVAIAIATAHAAPVATILLPPYPFGFPPGYGFIPQEQPNNGGGNTQDTEQTTTKTTTTQQVDVQTTIREPETTTPLSTGGDTNFDQASSNQDPNFNRFPAPQPQPQPSNQDVNFRQYLAPAPPRPQAQPFNQQTNFRQYLAPGPPLQPQPSNQNLSPQYGAPVFRPQPPQQQLPYALPQPHHHHHHDHHHHHPHIHVYKTPQKLKTLVEVEKAPLAYIAPPPLPHFPHNHEAVKVVKHVHTFVPARAKLIIRPVSNHNTRSVPVKVFEYKNPLALKASSRAFNVRPNVKEAEFTTFRPFPIPNTKPPRL